MDNRVKRPQNADSEANPLMAEHSAIRCFVGMKTAAEALHPPTLYHAIFNAQEQTNV